MALELTCRIMVKVMDERHFSPSKYHLHQLNMAVQELAFKGQEFSKWQIRLRRRLTELLGGFPRKKIDLEPLKLETKETEDYLLEKFVFRSEPYADVPCYLLKPKRIRYPAPAMICLQGHTSGMHISVGKVKYEHDKAAISGDRDFALQAVENGFIALAIEQRSFGERKEQVQERVSPHGCHDAVMHSLMLGKTLQGERVWDVMRGVDLLMEMDEVEKKYIACMGNSGGGTTTFYAACMDTRISGAIVSCSFCTYADSIMKIYHCADNYIPGVLKVAEMYDLTGCIAPRPFLIVAGKKDEIFPIHGVEKAYKRAKRIYRAAGAPRNIKLVVGDDGHRFYRDPSWRFFKEMLGIH